MSEVLDDGDGALAALAALPSGRLAEFMPYRLSIASNAVSDLIAERYRKRFGLKVPEWRIMAVLGDAAAPANASGEEGQALTQRTLTAATLMDKVAVNRAVKVLEARGLVLRRPNPGDGRSHLIALTGLGREIHAEVMPLALATEAELLAGLSPPEQAQLDRLLQGLRDRALALLAPEPGPPGQFY